jgi:hypothetical protein
LGITLDSGALIGADRNDERVWKVLRTAVSFGVVPVVPAPALAQAWRGKSSARLAQALLSCDIEPLDEALAKQAGELCASAGTSDIVDAAVVVGAARRRHSILTSDKKDLSRLAMVLGGVEIVDLRDVR